MARAYTYLIAGLPEVSLDSETRGFDFQRIMDDFRTGIVKEDAQYLRLLLLGLPLPTPYFYGVAGKSKNRFIREYFAIDVLLRNIRAGVAARKQNVSADTYLVGENAITEAIRSSKAVDFGLSGEMEDVAEIMSILDLPDLLEREQKLDLFRWNKVNKISLFHYFDIDAVLAFTVKAFLVNRWLLLDKKRGIEMFKELLKDCRGETDFVRATAKM